MYLKINLIIYEIFWVNVMRKARKNAKRWKSKIVGFRKQGATIFDRSYQPCKPRNFFRQHILYFQCKRKLATASSPSFQGLVFVNTQEMTKRWLSHLTFPQALQSLLKELENAVICHWILSVCRHWLVWKMKKLTCQTWGIQHGISWWKFRGLATIYPPIFPQSLEKIVGGFEENEAICIFCPKKSRHFLSMSWFENGEP